MHNKHYWEGGQYIGVGPGKCYLFAEVFTTRILLCPGAHSRFVPHGENEKRRTARIQVLEPDPWMFEVEKNGHATRLLQPLDPQVV
jgi:hypothetical protein